MMKDLSQAARELADYMREISESAYSAGWMRDLEFDLWAAVLEGKQQEYGSLILNEKQLKALRALADHAGGWIHFHELTEETFLPMSHWEILFAKSRTRGH